MAKEKEKQQKQGEVATRADTEPGIQRATPARALNPFEEMDRMFENFFPRGWMRPMRWDWPSQLGAPFEGKMPKVDVVDRDTEVVVRAEIPGVKKEDIDISVNESHVTIKAATRAEEEKEEGDYYRCEISQGAFTRTIGLPGDVDGEKAKATFKDGMLELTMPKLERSKRHTIKVQ